MYKPSGEPYFMRLEYVANINTLVGRLRPLVKIAGFDRK